MGASTGGTISGVGKYLKSQNADIKCVLVDPVGSVLKGYQEHGAIQPEDNKKFLVEGVGKNNVPGALDIQQVDWAVSCSDNEAFATCHRLAREEGLSVGGSAGLNVHAALNLAKEVDTPAVIVTLLCDQGVKYLSKVFSPDWLAKNKLDVPQEPRIKYDNEEQ